MASVYVFYQYLYPDPNVSSVHLSELCAGLAARGWQVTGYPGNRNLEDVAMVYPAHETWQGVMLRRLWRPAFSRSSGLGRILGAAWMVGRWSLLALKPGRGPDAIVVGTDPILSVCIAMVWRLLRPKTVIAHWCFDLYPEAAYAEGLLSQNGVAAKVFNWALTRSYRACDLIVDIGVCMRGLIGLYGSKARVATLVPWALSEPAAALGIAARERAGIYDGTGLLLMYSGTFGRAHSSEDMLELMGLLGDGAQLAFSVKGQRAAALRTAAEGMANVSFVPFAALEDLEKRLAAADIHVVSLREEWTGMVVPSKFFGAMAVGRPVLFCGSAKSALAVWIREYGLGWVLEPGGAAAVADEMRRVMVDPAALAALRERCFATYQREFSRAASVGGWVLELEGLVRR